MNTELDFSFAWDLETNLAEEFVRPELLAQANEENNSEGFALELACFDEKEQEDKLWQARTGLNYETLCGAVETIIFMSDRPQALKKIKDHIDPDLPLRVVFEAITKLQAEYEQKHHGIRLMEVAEGYQFRTKATYSKFVQDLFKVNSIVLSPTALEVLAIIAYKQPVSKTEVDRIRGVDSSHIVRALMDKRLVKIAGRSEELGRPSLYATTQEFLEVFNLADISNLPPEHELEEIASGNSVGQISDIKTIVAGDKTAFSHDELEELDQLSQSIKDIASDTLFTKQLLEEDKRATDAGERKSAFDLLEEFVNREQALTQNQKAAGSDILTNAPDARVIDLALYRDQLLNTPKFDEEEIEEILNAASNRTWDEIQAAQDVPNNSEELFGDDLFEIAQDNLDTEALALEAALDQAFENLSIDWPSEEIEDLEEKLEDAETLAMEQARELDLDLDFLKQTHSDDLDLTDSNELD
jgi:segregation and condensation protein B